METCKQGEVDERSHVCLNQVYSSAIGEIMLANYHLILFDMGNTLIHNEPMERLYLYYVYQELRKVSPRLSFEEFFETRISLLKEGDADWINSFGGRIAPQYWQKISDTSWERVLLSWDDIIYTINGVTDTLVEVSRRVDMAILANQPSRSLAAVARLGLGHAFRFIAFDSLIGLKKPDPNFFLWALTRAGLNAAQVLYVGDRMDHDIIPAHEIGMHTAWICHFPCDIPPYVEPYEWCQLYLGSVRTIGVHNQHEYMSGLGKQDATFTSSSVTELFSRDLDHWRKHWV